MGAETVMGAEGIGDRGQGLAQMLGHHLLVRDVVGHAAQPVHIVGKGEKTGRDIGQAMEGLAHHGRAHDLAESADMGQAGGAVARLEQDMALLGRLAVQTLEQPLRLLKGPGLGVRCEVAFCGHGGHGYPGG
jgi:hypothetical protein